MKLLSYLKTVLYALFFYSGLWSGGGRRHGRHYRRDSVRCKVWAGILFGGELGTKCHISASQSSSRTNTPCSVNTEGACPHMFFSGRKALTVCWGVLQVCVHIVFAFGMKSAGFILKKKNNNNFKAACQFCFYDNILENISPLTTIWLLAWNGVTVWLVGWKGTALTTPARFWAFQRMSTRSTRSGQKKMAEYSGK